MAAMATGRPAGFSRHHHLCPSPATVTARDPPTEASRSIGAKELRISANQRLSPALGPTADTTLSTGRAPCPRDPDSATPTALTGPIVYGKKQVQRRSGDRETDV